MMTPRTQPSIQRRIALYAIGIFAIAGALLAALWVAQGQDYMVDGDFFKLWLAGHMTWTGEDPYSSSDWIAAHEEFGSNWVSEGVYLYPLPLATIWAPLGGLPLRAASVLWVFLSILMILGGIMMLVKAFKIPVQASYVLPILAGALAYRPTLVTLRNGQLSALLFFILAGVIVLWEREKWLYGGLLLPFLSLKPSVGLPLIGLLGLWLLWRRRWPALLGAGVSQAAVIAAGLWRDPGWLGRYLVIGGDKFSAAFGQSPTVWGWTASLLCNRSLPCTLVSSLAVSTVILILTAVFLFRTEYGQSPAGAAAVLVPAGLLLPPYLWAYDQILLLLPVLFIAGWVYNLGGPYLVSATLPLSLAVLSLIMLFVATLQGHDAWSVAVPFMVWLVAGVAGLVSLARPGVLGRRRLA
jgi:hypothetical protein